MTLALAATQLECRNFPVDQPASLMRVTSTEGERDAAYLCDGSTPPDGFQAYLVPAGLEAAYRNSSLPTVVLPSSLDYLAENDIVRLSPAKNTIRVIFRRNSPNNSLLVTERCNHYCLMCSQPPKTVDDTWIADELLNVIPLIDPTVESLGLTGGEPTLLGDRFLAILRAVRTHLPSTYLHILSNGRNFARMAFAKAYAEVGNPRMMVGIPIYSDSPARHNYVVQAEGAFHETIRGILNLKRLGQRVEVRVVLHKQTYERLPQLAEFLARNLTFVNHVALMGLEMTGLTLANEDDLWVDSFDYQSQLEEAVQILQSYEMNVSVYNHQLCILPRSVWPVARKSISDWKNNYLPVCGGCTEKANCGGFFSSGRPRYSQHLTPFSA